MIRKGVTGDRLFMVQVLSPFSPAAARSEANSSRRKDYSIGDEKFLSGLD
jgi:hypothetical protein